MNYQETIDFLFGQLPLFSRIGEKAIKKDLHNIRALCQQLGNPQDSIKTIHIAGTNGKGSCSHMLAAVLQSAGYKTGLYTSPHIHDFRERIRIDGKMIPEQKVIDFVSQIFPTELEPSFFEITVAMAFEYFAQEQVDIAIIETGLGGRLDSTNIIHPLLSVITNIGWDHTQLLGDSLEAIASEKAGIIKSGTPVVIGEYLPETVGVFKETAPRFSAPLFFAQEITQTLPLGDGKYSVNTVAFPALKEVDLDLKGAYQSKNLRTVLTSLQMIKQIGFEIKEDHIQKGLAAVGVLTGLQGRWQLMRKFPTVIADVGHNQDGIKEILQQLSEEYSDKPWHFILGFVRDKDIDGVLDLFPQKATYYFTNAHMPRALPCVELQKIAEEKGLKGIAFDDINVALHQATENASSDSVIVICGSFFILSELKKS